MPVEAASGAPRRALLAMVALSGAGGLTWELLWQHRAALALGVSAFGAAVTLASLMAGFALGGLAAARRARRGGLGRPLRGYAAAELLVGAGGLLVGPGLDALAAIDAPTWALAPWLAALVQVGGIAALLLVPSAAMGATLPILAAAAPRAGVRVASLYAVNTAGAVAGIAVATFGALPLCGVGRTGALAAGLDFAVALWALRADRAWGPPPNAADPIARPPSLPRAAIGIAFASGLGVLALEVAWFRSLRAAFQSTTESFAVMLAAFLLPLAVGAALAPRVRARIPRGLPVVVAIAATFALLATPLVDRMDALAPMSGSWTLSLWRFGLAAGVLAVPVTLLGLPFPWLLDEHPDPASAGRLYAWNTVGAVIGALGAGFVLLPALGATRASWVAALALAIAGLLAGLRVRSPGAGRPRAVAVAGSLVLVAGGLAAAWAFDSGAGRRRVQGLGSPGWREIHYVAEGPDATVSVVTSAGGARKLIIDGFDTAGESGGEHYMPWMGHLPALAAPSLARALVICFGTGQTADAVRAHGPGRLDVVDVSGAVLRAAPFFEKNHRVLEDPRVHAVVMDGRAWLRRAPLGRYDLVTLEPMAPNFAGTNNLYSREFYALVRSRLAPAGVVAQWVPFHLLTPDDLAAIVATFAEAFPHARLWIDPPTGTGILIGSPSPWRLHPSQVALELRDDEIAAGIALDEPGVAMLAQAGTPITDDNQRLAYGLGRLDKARFVGALGGSAGLSQLGHEVVARFHAAESAAPR